MNELRELLSQHYKLYPMMQIKDAVKLIYQNEFGCGHLIKDEASSLTHLVEELDTRKNQNDNESLFTDIGNSFVRLNLNVLKNCDITPITVNKLFVLTSKRHKGNLEAFKAKLKLIYELPFNIGKIQKFMTDYQNAGYPMISHSDVYRNNYYPSYRVIDKKYTNLFDMFNMIDLESEKGNKVIVGIDGKCGSGKSTVADILSDVYGCDVIHMDDFFLPLELRTENRLTEVGGNIHYERFIDEVALKLKNLNSEKPFNYRIFDCSIMNYNGTRTIQSRPQDIIIVEGSYSLHPKYSSIYDIKVFVNVDNDEQKRRIIRRDGEMMWDKYENVWIPMETEYFKKYNIKENSDIVIER